MIMKRTCVLPVPDVVGVLLDERRSAYLRTLARWVFQSMYRVNRELKDTGSLIDTNAHNAIIK